MSNYQSFKTIAVFFLSSRYQGYLVGLTPELSFYSIIKCFTTFQKNIPEHSNEKSSNLQFLHEIKYTFSLSGRIIFSYEIFTCFPSFFSKLEIKENTKLEVIAYILKAMCYKALLVKTSKFVSIRERKKKTISG